MRGKRWEERAGKGVVKWNREGVSGGWRGTEGGRVRGYRLLTS